MFLARKGNEHTCRREYHLSCSLPDAVLEPKIALAVTPILQTNSAYNVDSELTINAFPGLTILYAPSSACCSFARSRRSSPYTQSMLLGDDESQPQLTQRECNGFCGSPFIVAHVSMELHLANGW